MNQKSVTTKHQMDMSELRMYILLNSSVKMGLGKSVAQAGHGIAAVIETCLKHCPAHLKLYHSGDHAKITLKAPENLLKELVHEYSFNSQRPDSVWCHHVIDAGRTQVAPGTMTAVVFCPMREHQRPAALQSLKLA